MDYQVVILSEDTLFARMLELEFSFYHLKVLSADSLHPTDKTDVLILDLDSASAPSPDQYCKMIGFSRRPAMAAEDARSCSMILRRPFRMSLLRREVLSQTGEGFLSEPIEHPPALPSVREIRLDSEARILFCDRCSVSLSPQECRILQCLLEHRGKAVSRSCLSEQIGQSGGNKTDVYICYLRRKTDALPRGRLISTVRGEGYMIE